MKHLVVLTIVSLILIILSSLGSMKQAAADSPIVDGNIRDGPFCPVPGPKDGVPDCIINGSVVQTLDDPQFEVRGVIEFDISSLRRGKVALELPVFGSNGPFPFTIDVFAYAGDGALTLSDFNRGSQFTSFEYSEEPQVILDVTTVIQRLKSSRANFAGFRFEFAIPSNIPRNAPFLAFNSLEIPPEAQLVPDMMVRVCHKGKHTITISANAVPAHIRHGDISGACPTNNLTPKTTPGPTMGPPSMGPPLTLETVPMEVSPMEAPMLKGPN